MTTTDPGAQREELRRYAAAARDATEGRAACDCGTENCVHTDGARGWAATLYEEHVVEQLPESAVLARPGRGDPTAVADLREGETVSTSAWVADSTSSCRRAAWAKGKGSIGST
jgi:hypothetical protein